MHKNCSNQNQKGHERTNFKIIIECLNTIPKCYVRGCFGFSKWVFETLSLFFPKKLKKVRKNS